MGADNSNQTVNYLLVPLLAFASLFSVLCYQEVSERILRI